MRNDYLERYYNNPVAWAEEWLGVALWSKQKEILRSVFENRYTAVRSGHGIGKTFLAAVAVLAFLFLRFPSKIITSAPTWYQVKDLLWSEINSLFKKYLAPRSCPAKILQTRLSIKDDWFAVGISPKESVNFQGFHQKHVLVILDESPGVRREIFEGAETLMSAGDAHMLQIGNPVEAAGHFYDAFSNAEYKKMHISCFDSPNFTGEPVPEEIKSKLVTVQWVEEKRQQWGEDSPLWQSRVEGNFPVASEDQLISLAWCEEASRRESVGGEKRLGVDIARFGSDKTVYTIVEGNAVKEQFIDTKRDLMHIVGRIKSIMENENIEIVSLDDTGLGGGVTDRLRELNVRVNPVNGGEAAIESEKFYNRRTEIWWNMREWIRNEGVIPENTNLFADLTAPKFFYTSKGQIKLESKEEIRKRLGRSPDFGDSLAIALAMPQRMKFDSIRWLESERPFARFSKMQF